MVFVLVHISPVTVGQFTFLCVEFVKESDGVVTLESLFQTCLKRKEAFMMRSVQCSQCCERSTIIKRDVQLLYDDCNSSSMRLRCLLLGRDTCWSLNETEARSVLSGLGCLCEECKGINTQCEHSHPHTATLFFNQQPITAEISSILSVRLSLSLSNLWIAVVCQHAGSL